MGLPASSKRVVDSHLGMLLPPDELAKYTQQAVRGRSGRVHATVHAVPTCALPTSPCTQRADEVLARKGAKEVRCSAEERPILEPPATRSLLQIVEQRFTTLCIVSSLYKVC